MKRKKEGNVMAIGKAATAITELDANLVMK